MKVWSTTQVAGRLAAALGKHVTDAFVRDCYLEMHELQRMGSGHTIRITEAEAKFIIAYGVEWHGRPAAPELVAWAAEHRFDVPGLRQRLLPVRVARPPEPQKAATSTPEMMAINAVAAEVDKLKKTVAELASARGGRTRARQITDSASSEGSVIRRRLNKLVRSWVRDHFGAVTHAVAWSDLYRKYFAEIGEPIPREWYACQLTNEAKLDYFEKRGWLGVFVDAVPGFLVQMDEGLKVAAGQGELGI